MKLIIYACCGVLGAVQAFAQSATSRSMTLQEAILQTIDHNFDVQSSRFEPRIDQLSLTKSYATYEPSWYASGSARSSTTGGGYNSSIGVSTSANKSDSETYESGIKGTLPTGLQYDFSTDATKNKTSSSPNDQWSTSAGAYSLTQPLLKGFWWYSDSSIQIALNKKTIKYDELGVRQQLIDQVAATEQAYYSLISAFETIKVQEAALELAERLVAENKRKVEVGSMAPLDEKQAESQAASRRADLIASHGTLEKQQNGLKKLITDQYKNWRDISIIPADKLIVMPEKFDLQDSWRKGLTLRPDYLRVKVAIEKQAISVKQKRNQLLPQLNLTGQYSRSGIANTLGDSWDDIRTERLPTYQYGATISVPLGNRAARADYRSAKTLAEQQELTLRSTEQNILIGIDDAIKSANTAFQRIQATRAAREYAELALSAEQKKLDVGKSTSFEVLQLQNNLTSARLDEINAMADYNKSLSEISHQEGSILDRFNLTVRIY
jgi:outer membrane protein TolC